MNNNTSLHTSYIRLLNKAKVNDGKTYFNINIPKTIAEQLNLQSGNKMIIKLQNDNILIKRIEI